MPAHTTVILLSHDPGFATGVLSEKGKGNKKQCLGNVVDSSLSSLSFTSHAVHGGGGSRGRGVWGWGVQAGAGAGAGGLRGEGAGDISSNLPYILHYHMVLRPKGTSHNDLLTHFQSAV